MPARLGISGQADLRRAAAQFRRAERVDLTRELRASQQRAVKPLQKEVKASAAALLPKRGGYAAAMARSVKVTTLVNLGRGTVTAHIFARARKQHRDVRAVNLGVLRHPVFGNRRNWTVTTVAPRFVDRPVERLFDRIVDEAADGVQNVLNKLARG